jgi:hypothetical protein
MDFFRAEKSKRDDRSGFPADSERKTRPLAYLDLEGRIRLLFIYLLCNFIGKFLEMESEFMMGSFKIMHFWV